MASGVVGYLSDLIRIDTTNPPGNETATVRYVRSGLTSEGIKTQTIESAPGARTVPTPVTCCTDATYLRPRGITTYGFIPTPPGKALSTVHGIDERCSVNGFLFGADVLCDIAERLCC